ncbi:hypothetical protein CEXT_728751, partial [Caerostris extrusa]
PINKHCSLPPRANGDVSAGGCLPCEPGGTAVGTRRASNEEAVPSEEGVEMTSGFQT